MPNDYDVIVVGLGAMGSAATYQLAKAGARVLGVDRYQPPHTLGSSHGSSRITRFAGGEGKACVPLAMRSHQLWREIEREAGVELLSECGFLTLGIPRRGDTRSTKINGWFDQTLDTARNFGIDHTQLTQAELRKRFPQFSFSGPRGRILRARRRIRPARSVRQRTTAAGRATWRNHPEWHPRHRMPG